MSKQKLIRACLLFYLITREGKKNCPGAYALHENVNTCHKCKKFKSHFNKLFQNSSKKTGLGPLMGLKTSFNGLETRGRIIVVIQLLYIQDYIHLKGFV